MSNKFKIIMFQKIYYLEDVSNDHFESLFNGLLSLSKE